MPDTPAFVVNDRRKFTAEGELRHDAPTADTSSTTQPETATTQNKGPQLVGSETAAPSASLSEPLADQPLADHTLQDRDLPNGSEAAAAGEDHTPEPFPDDTLPPGPTDEQSAEATRAYDATVDRLDTALRAADPGGERLPEMNFERLVQSLYTQALLLLGGAAQPGETPRVDILGARQTIDMLAVVSEKSKGNLSPDEDKLLQSALFDLRMGFLEITQALARQASQRQGTGGPAGGPGAPFPGGGPGPRIVR